MEDVETLTSSILHSTKKHLGIAFEDDSFDAEVIMHINSVFDILAQIGVGSSEGFRIEGEDETWDDFLSTTKSDTSIQMVKSYMYSKVRMMFDPPTSSIVNEALKSVNSELEWRLSVAVDPGEEEPDAS